ncbi:flavodoxin domain-containing protein [Serinibacter salmoneus]|uniref:Menaquinone-dependent protoporphyrinogen oxidase n=1 Tax=Serinibacter salmoneus TaxID=556530 RepID=A0A2A9CYB4_9MICO|nr:flavodoxin domain-containing protein [Serinibacter salmoneus]PFG19428.1 menaquinone-dependent protoporphyrinogen oxidase [Serinibacter salmoneus]
MSVMLVTFSKHGSTSRAGEVVAQVLSEAGHEVITRTLPLDPPGRVTDDLVTACVRDRVSAVVLGAAVYMNAWAPGALAAQQALLAADVPVFAFALGLQDVTDEPESAQWSAPRQGSTADERVKFGGTIPSSGLSLKERAIVKMVRAAPGEHTDWDAVRAWARDVAAAVPGV